MKFTIDLSRNHFNFNTYLHKKYSSQWLGHFHWQGCAEFEPISLIEMQTRSHCNVCAGI